MARKRRFCPECYAEVRVENIDEHDWWHMNLRRDISDAKEQG